MRKGRCDCLGDKIYPFGVNPGGTTIVTDGNLKIEADFNGVWISALSNDFTMETVVQFLRVKGVRKYDESVVKEFARQKNRTPQKIANRDPLVEKDSAVIVLLSKDNMTASVTVAAPFFTNSWASKADVLEALKQKNVVYGVDENVIEELTKLKTPEEHVVVANGKPPINGDTARIELLLDPDQAPVVDCDAEKIDHRDRSAFVYVKQGDTVAVKYPATQGESGMTVVGTVVKAVEGKDKPFPIAGGLDVSEDGLSLTAAIDGRLMRKNNKLSVLPELVINGDVDFGVGNIDFRGSVKVLGTVRDGFHVMATNDIEIKQMVEGAVVESSTDIIVSGGIQGMGRGHIIAAGNITANFVNQAYLRSNAEIKVVNSILHSDVSAHNTVTVMGSSKSQIIGGKIQAELGVVCNTLGSEIGTKTEVFVGVPPFLIERRSELEDSIFKNTESLEMLEADFAFLKKQEQNGALNEKQRSALVTTIKSRFQLQAALKSNQDELEDINNRLELSRVQGVVKVKDVCYPGVLITIRDSTYVVREAFRNVAFVYDRDAGEIKLRPFNEVGQ